MKAERKQTTREQTTSSPPMCYDRDGGLLLVAAERYVVEYPRYDHIKTQSVTPVAWQCTPR